MALFLQIPCFLYLFKGTLNVFCMFDNFQRTLEKFQATIWYREKRNTMSHAHTYQRLKYLFSRWRLQRHYQEERKRKNREKLVLFNKWQHPWNFTNFSQSYSYRTKLNHVLKGSNAFSHIYCRKFQRLPYPLKQKH